MRDIYDSVAEETFNRKVCGHCLAIEEVDWMNPEDREAVWKPFAEAFRELSKRLVLDEHNQRRT